MEETSDPDLLIPDEEEAPTTSGTSTSTSSTATTPSSGAVVFSTSATVDAPAYSSNIPGENALKLTSGSVSLSSGSIKKSGPAASPVENAAVWVGNSSLTLSRTELIVTADAAPAFALASIDPASSVPPTLTLDGVYAEISSGDTFYISNATADLTLSGSTFKNLNPSSNFLRAEASSLGEAGANGGHARVSLVNQVLEGNISADSLSSVSLSFSSSYYMGFLNPADSARSFSVTLDSTSNIILAGDSYLSELSNADPENLNIFSNGYKLFVAGEEVAVNGSEAPALPEVEKKTEPAPAETTPEESSLETTAWQKCGPGSTAGLKDCTSSGPSIIFFILGGILIALAIVVPILVLKRKKEK